MICVVYKYIIITLSHFQLFRRGKKERPRSADVSSMFFESLDSTQATTATQLWIPKPLSKDPDSKASKVSYRHVRLISQTKWLVIGWEFYILKLVMFDDKLGLEHRAGV